MTTAEQTLIPHPELEAWVRRVLERAGLPPDHAADAAAVLLSANLRGVDSHGVLQLAAKVQRARKGWSNPRPDVRVEREGPAMLAVDGGNGLGMVVGVWAMRQAIARARESGAAAATVRRSGHFGAAAHYVQMASAAGMIGLCGTNGGACMAPWGGVTPFLGTNPLAVAAPGGIEGGLVLDMASSQVAWGKVELAARAGQKIPLTWATDIDGRPTDDPHKGLAGLMLPLGGYKGYGLGLMIEVLTGVLSGSAVGPHVGNFMGDPQAEDVGHFFMALDIEHFMPLPLFLARIERMVSEIRASRLAEGATRIYVPGEIEAETAARRRQEGIPLPVDVVRDLRALGEELGEAFVV